MLAFSFIRSLNNITSAEKAKYLHFQQHKLFAPLLLLPLSNMIFRFVFVFGGGDSLIGKLLIFMETPSNEIIFILGSGFFLSFHHGVHLQEILLFFQGAFFIYFYVVMEWSGSFGGDYPCFSRFGELGK